MDYCPDADLASLPLQIGSTKFGDFEVEVIDPVDDYLATLKEVSWRYNGGWSNMQGRIAGRNSEF